MHRQRCDPFVEEPYYLINCVRQMYFHKGLHLCIGNFWQWRKWSFCIGNLNLIPIMLLSLTILRTSISYLINGWILLTFFFGKRVLLTFLVSMVMCNFSLRYVTYALSIKMAKQNTNTHQTWHSHLKLNGFPQCYNFRTNQRRTKLKLTMIHQK